MKLEYSQLTDKVYMTSKNGKKEECTQNFLQVMLLWFHELSPTMTPGQKFERSLRPKGSDTPDWVLTIEKK